MCGAPCAAVVGGRSAGALLVFHLARTASYAMGGAVAAASVGALAAMSQITPALRPLWTLLHVLALALGLWLLWKGRQPAWMGQLGRVPLPATETRWQRVNGPLRAAVGGGLWVAWPCGLLQSALVVAGLAGNAWSGATAMAAFAIASSGGLVLAPWLWQRYLSGPRAGHFERWVVRLSGLMLIAASGWTLGHGIWHQVAAFCQTL
jgi:sulfite exporter TauE/SafE